MLPPALQVPFSETGAMNMRPGVKGQERPGESLKHERWSQEAERKPARWSRAGGPRVPTGRNGDTVLGTQGASATVCQGHGCGSHTHGRYGVTCMDTAIQEVKRYHNGDT